MKNIFVYIIMLSLYSSVISSPKWYIEEIDNIESSSLSTDIDSKNYPHIAYCDRYNRCIKYAYFDGSKWNIEIVDEGPSYDLFYTSLALDSKDYPHISYYTGINLKYAYFDGSKWNIEIVEDNDNRNRKLDIGIGLDNQDHPYIIYCNNDKDKYLRCAYYDGSKWNFNIIDYGHTSSTIMFHSSITIDSKGNPHVAYINQWHDYKPPYYDEYYSDLKNAYFNGTYWDVQIAFELHEEGYGMFYTSISTDSKFQPHITTQIHYRIFHIYREGYEWKSEYVDTEPNNYRPSIAIDSKNNIHVAYLYNDLLKYAFFNGYEWNIYEIDKQNNYMHSCSISIDKKDYPHISYTFPDKVKYARYGYGLGIDLTSFTATPNNDAITLNWSVSTDVAISGFNLYRRPATPTVSPVRENAQSPLQSEDNYVWTKVNTSLITGENPYSYTDRDIAPETSYEYKLEAVVSDKNETLGTTSATSGNGTPDSFEITKVYPTPASSQINIDVIIPEQTDIDISIYDITGRKVSTIAGGQYNSGEYTLTGDISCFTNGVYIVKMSSDGFGASKNFVVAK